MVELCEVVLDEVVVEEFELFECVECVVVVD